MKIEDICLDIYREECERASDECTELFEAEIVEISLPDILLEDLFKCDFSEYDTLVGAMRSPRQFGVCLKRKFYHIPAFYVEEYPIPKYIALYQSQRMFGDEVSGLKYYGEVRKCTPMRRNKIREIPKNSNELYYKFKVKSWKRLDTPLSSGELGFVRLFTNSFLLQNVDDISALTISDVYEFRLYKLLRLADAQINGRNDIARFCIDGFDVIFTYEVIYLCFDGKIRERYYRSGLSQAPSHLLGKIKKDIAVLVDKNDKDKEKHDEI